MKIGFIVLAFFSWMVTLLEIQAQQLAKPNIVLILADDLGWSDLGCYGGDLVETPHLDQLAKEGMRFTDAYAMSVCSPSRAGLLTGKHPARLRITVWAESALNPGTNRPMLEAESDHNLSHKETTLASHLRDSGYLTALIGKWHLGDADHFPETHGFDVNRGGNHWGAPHTFWWPYRGSGTWGTTFRYVPHMDFGHKGEYLTDRLTNEAIQVMEQSEGRPFFLMLSHYAPHTPIQAKAADIEYFEKKLQPEMNHQNPVYAAMIKSLDESVGRVLDHLKKKGLADHTIVVFASDNGGFTGIDKRADQTQPTTSNLPLRSGKGSLYEGGIRVPLLIRWPGHTPAGSVCKKPVILMDLFHTLREAAGLPSEIDSHADGEGLVDLLKNPAASWDRDTLFFHFPHYYETTGPVGAIRSGEWKLIEYFDDSRVELYRLSTDLGETSDLAHVEAEKTAELQDALHRWRTSVNAAMPIRNPAIPSKANSNR